MTCSSRGFEQDRRTAGGANKARPLLAYRLRADGAAMIARRAKTASRKMVMRAI